MAFKQLLRGSLGEPKPPASSKDRARGDNTRGEQSKGGDSPSGAIRTNVLYVTGDARESRLVAGAFNFAHPHLNLDLSIELKEARIHLAVPAKYDALVIGWSVPEDEGLELIRHVRQQGYHIGVVAAGEQALDDYREAGADQCVEKGGSFLARLPVAIEEAAKGRRAARPPVAAPAPSETPAPPAADRTRRVAFAGDLEQLKADLNVSAAPLQLVSLAQALKDADVRPQGSALEFDAVVIDHGTGAGSASLLADVRARNLDVPVLLLVAPSEERAAYQAFGQTVDEYLAKTTGWPSRLAVRVEIATARHQQLRDLAALRVREARLRSMVDGLPASVIRLSPDGLILATNAAAGAMLGAPASPPNPLLRTPFESLVSSDDREAWAELLTHVREGQQRSAELSITTLDAVQRVVDATAVPGPSDSGRTTSIVMVLRDITAHKRLQESAAETGRSTEEAVRVAVEEATRIATEEAARQAAEAAEARAAGAAPDEAPSAVPAAPAVDPNALREMEQDLHRLAGHARAAFSDLGTLLQEVEARHDAAFARQVEGYARFTAEQLERSRALEGFLARAAYGVVHTSLDGALVDANAAFAQALGHESPADLVAAAPSIAALVNPDEWTQAVAAWSDGQTDEPLELRWRRKDRSLATLRLHGRLVTDLEGCQRIEVFAEDLSAHRALELQLRRARRWEDVARVTSGIAADLSQAVASVSESSGRLAHDPSAAGDQVGSVQQAAAKALALSRQLVAFGRREARDPLPLDLNAVVQGLDAVLRRLLDEHIELSLDLTPGLGAAEAAQPAVEEALVNLTVAARDALPAGGQIAIGTVDLDLDRESPEHDGVEPGTYAVLSLTASGWGMEPDAVSRMLAGPSALDGAGRSVSVARAAVSQSGGVLRVEGVPEESVSFTVYLPRTGGPRSDRETVVAIEA